MTAVIAEAHTPLYAAHLRLGAKMSPFGGFLMPISYAGILDEHKAVRAAAGIFDLSHMGQFSVCGQAGGAWLDRLTTNAITTMRPNQARYTLFTDDRGGTLDDTIVYRFPDRWLIVVNGSNTGKMWKWLSEHANAGLSLENRTPRSALIAIQGPRSAEMIQPLTRVDLASIKYYYAAEGSVGGVQAQIARTGYTGEDGFELFIAAENAESLWNRLCTEGARVNALPAGLGARDILRLEAGMPLYGHELSEEITPLMAGLDWAVKFNKLSFIGKSALEAQKQRGDYDRIVGIIMDGRVPAREGYAVYKDGARVGTVRSGSPAPALGGRNIATALVRQAASAQAERLEVEVRGKPYPATVVPQPFYRRPKDA